MRNIIRAGVVLLFSIPAVAQVDFAGNWAARYHQDWQDRAIGPDVVEYLGIPLSNAGRAKALTTNTWVLK